MIQYYHHNTPFHLQLGGTLQPLTIAYHTYGRLNADRSNVVWVCHALTANSDVADWWPHTVEKGAFLDPERWFVICANILGSHYGTTGPLTPSAATGKPLYGDFPALTIADMARAHALLADALGITKIHKLVGSSVGGFQALEWAAQEPDRFDSLILIATAPVATRTASGCRSGRTRSGPCNRNAHLPRRIGLQPNSERSGRRRHFHTPPRLHISGTSGKETVRPV